MEAVKTMSVKRSRPKCEPRLPNAEAGPKKRASEKQLPVRASARNRDSKSKSSKDEIDDIFAKKKRTDEAQRRADVPDESSGATSAQMKKQQKRKDQKMGSKGKEGRKETSDGGKARRKTADGLSIYGADELKWNTKSAGGTPLCPFDCACCF